MSKNVGGIDRTLRLVGLVPIFTGLFSPCPLYSILGLNTCLLKRGGK